MRYSKTIDIWTLDTEARAKLPVGQWVTAGPEGPKGRFFGEGNSTVVAWLGNAKGSRDYRGYMRTLRDYGRASVARAGRS